MATYLLEIADAQEAELQRAVAQMNRTKLPETPDIDALGLLRLWVDPRLDALVQKTAEQVWSARRAAYDAATPETRALVDAALGLDARPATIRPIG